MDIAVLNKLCYSMESCFNCEIWRLDGRLWKSCRDILDEYPDEAQAVLEKWRVDHEF